MPGYQHKSGPHRAYSAEELALFARYRGERERVRPKACTGDAQCWAEHGPPAITRDGKCLGCRGRPRSTTAPGYHGWGQRL